MTLPTAWALLFSLYQAPGQKTNPAQNVFELVESAFGRCCVVHGHGMLNSCLQSNISACLIEIWHDKPSRYKLLHVGLTFEKPAAVHGY
jgi:hypothetical protein